MGKAKYAIVIIFLMSIIGFFLYFGLNVTRELNQEKLIKEELDRIKELNQNKEENKEALDEVYTRRVTKGDYIAVETALKNYEKDLYSYIDNINYLASSEIVDYLSAENIKNDMKEFTKSKQSISDTKSQITDNINKLNDLLNNETVIMGYLDTTGLKKYYIEYYKSLVGGSGIEPGYLEEKYSGLIERLDVYENAIDFLIENKNKWKLEEKLGKSASIMFDDKELVEKWKEITEKLENKTKNLQEE